MEKPREQIGAGYSKKVFSDPENQQRVDIEFREKLTNNQIKSVYYFNKLLKLFYPNNIPNVYIAGNKDDSYIKAEKLERDTEHERTANRLVTDDEYFMGNADSVLAQEDRDEVDSQIQIRTNDPRVLQFVKSVYQNGFLIDPAGQNYVFSKDGTLKYVELNPAWEYHFGEMMRSFDPERLEDAINKLLPSQREQATQYLNRINALLEEEIG